MVGEREAGAGDAVLAPFGADRQRVVAVHEPLDQPDERAVVAGAERVGDIARAELDDHVAGRHLAWHRDLDQGVAARHLIGAP